MQKVEHCKKLRLRWEIHLAPPFLDRICSRIGIKNAGSAVDQVDGLAYTSERQTLSCRADANVMVI